MKYQTNNQRNKKEKKMNFLALILAASFFSNALHGLNSSAIKNLEEKPKMSIIITETFFDYIQNMINKLKETKKEGQARRRLLKNRCIWKVCSLPLKSTTKPSLIELQRMLNYKSWLDNSFMGWNTIKKTWN